MDEERSWRLQYSDVMPRGLERLDASKGHPDTTIIVEDKTFDCHKAILCAISPYFEAMFSSGMTESVSGVVRIEWTESSVFEAVLEYIYKGTNTIINRGNAEAIFEAAFLLQMDCLQKRCEKFLSRTLTIRNSLDRWRLAAWHCCKKLQQKVWKFIIENFVILSQQDSFLRMDIHELLPLIKDDELQCPDEEVVVRAVLKWVKHDLKTRVMFVADIFPHLRLPLTRPGFLFHILKRYSFVKEDSECRKHIDHAQRFQLLPNRHYSSNPVTCHRTTSTFEDIAVVISGGQSPRPPYVRSREVLAFGFTSRRWFHLAPLPYDLGIESASCVRNNDICVTGGALHKKGFLRYRATKGEWYHGRAGLNNGRTRHAMAACGNSIFVLGGYNNKLEEGSRVLSSIEEFDFSTDQWVEVGNLTTAVCSMSVSVSKDKIFIFGGETNDGTATASIQCFDTVTHTVSRIADLPIACKLTRAVVCNQCTYIILNNGKIFELDHLTETVKTIGDIQKFDRQHFGLVHRRGCLTLMGGQRLLPGPNPAKALTDSMLSYDVRNQRVSELNDRIPAPRLVDSCSKITIDRKFLITGILKLRPFP